MNMQSINTQALMKASGIGLGVAFVMSLISNGIGYFSSQAATGNISDEAALGLLGALGFVAICACCVGYLAYLGVGYLYGMFAGQSGTPVETGTMALGGAASALVVGVLAGLCNGVISLVTGVSQFSQVGGVGGDAAAAGLAGSVVGLFVGLCIAIVLSAALGAGGGAIYAATQGNKAAAAPPPAM